MKTKRQSYNTNVKQKRSVSEISILTEN